MTSRILALAAALMFATAGVGWAQDTSGSIVGRVTDAQGLAVPGATVTVTGPQGSRTYTTDADGRFAAPLLVPGTYSVKAELENFKTADARNIVVGLNQTTTVGLKMEIGAQTETVEVMGASTVVDTSSTTTGGTLDSEMLKRLPVGRNFTDTLYLVPGVVENSGQLGRANPSIGGGSGLENSYIVDGVNITDTGFGGVGSYNSIHGSLGSGVTTDFIKETQVKTGGYEAEFGESTGGVVNVVTKSGANQFSGSTFGYFQPSALEAGWDTFNAPNGTVNTTGRDEYDIGISLGGRILPDRLFFYGTYNRQFQDRTFIAPEPISGVTFPYRALGGVTRERRIHSYAAKLTSQVSMGNRIDVSVFGDPSTGASGLQRYSTLRRIAYSDAPGTADIEGGFSELKYGGHNQTVRYDGIIRSSWLVEAAASHARNRFHEIPTVDEWFYDDFRFTPIGESGGLGDYERDNGKNVHLSAKSTHIFNMGGQHQIRYGIQYEDIEFTRDFDYSGPNFLLGDGTMTVTGGTLQIRSDPSGLPAFFRATRGKTVPTASTFQDYTSLFIQDTWQIGRLTVRPGVRWDQQKLTGVDPTGDNPDLCFEGDSRPGQGDGTGPAIPCEVTWKNVAPRIGATFDLFGNGRAKIYGAWGRFYGKIPNDLAARSLSADAGITRADYFDAGLTQPIPEGVSHGGTASHLRFAGLHAAPVDPDAGSTYKNEFVGGAEFEVFGSANLGVRYVRRNMPQILEDISDLPMLGYFTGDPGVLGPDDECSTASTEYVILNVNASVPTVNCGFSELNSAFEDPKHTYDSVEVTLNKRFRDNWGLISSYRWSRLEGNFEGFYRSDNGQSDPAITSLFDFPTNDPSYTAIGVPVGGFRGDIRYLGSSLGQGVLPNDRPHQFKLYGNYLWKDLNLGAGVNVGSGRPLTALAANPLYDSDGEIPETVRGAGIDTINGFRKRADADATVDLHADYTLRFGGDRQRVLLLMDVFNLFNRQAATDYDTFTEVAFGAANANFGMPLNGGSSSIPSFQTPLAVRLGARLEW